MNEDQEKMEGPVFELREPNQRDSHLNIEVVQNGKTKRYVATLSAAAYGEGRSLAEALHDLANTLDAHKIYGSEKYDPEHLVGNKLRKCQYCGAKIFFALTSNDKWMPLDGYSVEGKELNGLVRAYYVEDINRRPHVKSLSNPQGEVWIPHPEVCGANKEGPPASVKLLWTRWKANCVNALDLEEAAVKDLQEIVTELGGP